jgi:hypothetical protein
MIRRSVLFVLLLLTWVRPAGADVFRPAYLELREKDAETFDVMWKVPSQGTMRLAIRVVFPDGTVRASEPRGVFAGDGFVERWTVRRPAGLAGGTIRIDGLPGSITDVLARVERREGTTQVARLLPENPAFVVESPEGSAGVAWTYPGLGVHHILAGVDHLLIVQR